ncbi:C6 transcription factor [Penicillium alfredii]|uniref:C6 transcription factor n=1 Tax=Penicillium alfredii TaxID=1506179 RepID=A0A9W9K7P2_9EURO|nr:C6 transcription factor [Penicillium alfredii]KAJ5095880.1 C6 transcription factor [Penicillium alfredii]
MPTQATDVMHQSKSQPRGRKSAGLMQGQKSVFRVPNYKSQKDLTHGPEEPSREKVYHARRPHRKSRGGCSNCKQRRVKCDEAKPTCLRCQKHGVDCDYTARPVRPWPSKNIISQFIESQPDLLSVDSLSSSMSLLLVADKLDELLRSGAGAGRRPKVRTDTPLVLQALQHFHNTTISTDSAKKTMAVMMGKVTELAFQTPFLMHAIIAVSTTHLCSVLPDTTAYRVAEAHHWQQAINQYSREVGTSVNQNNMDQLFSTCMLLSVHSFLLEEFNPRASFVFSDDPTTLNWLFLQGGLRYLLERVTMWLPTSMWWASFAEAHDPNIDFEDARPGRIDLDPDFADLCRIDESSTVNSNPYLWPLRMLTPLLKLERSPVSFQKYNTWMGRLEPPYYDCLLLKDPPALVLLAWWLSLMASVDKWWVDTRVRSECTAICMRLEDSEDPLVLRLLEFPAQTCGYLLRHVQERVAFESCADLLSIS